VGQLRIAINMSRRWRFMDLEQSPGSAGRLTGLCFMIAQPPLGIVPDLAFNSDADGTSDIFRDYFLMFAVHGLPTMTVPSTKRTFPK